MLYLARLLVQSLTPSMKKISWPTFKLGSSVSEYYIQISQFCPLICSSQELFASLNALRDDQTLAQYILDVRGRGLMVAMEFASSEGPGAAFDPATPKGLTVKKGIASRVTKKCIEKGMLLLTTSVYEVVRFIPPLNISQEDMKKGCDIFAESLREVVREG